MLVGSIFWGTWEDPGGVFFKFAVKRVKTIPNSPYGGETSSYSLLQKGVHAQNFEIFGTGFDHLGLTQHYLEDGLLIIK